MRSNDCKANDKEQTLQCVYSWRSTLYYCEIHKEQNMTHTFALPPLHVPFNKRIAEKVIFCCYMSRCVTWRNTSINNRVCTSNQAEFISSGVSSMQRMYFRWTALRLLLSKPNNIINENWSENISPQFSTFTLSFLQMFIRRQIVHATE